jgi:predicted phage-related endonuclease
MPTQSFESHAHQPRLTIIGYVFVLIALVALTLRWLQIGGRVSFAAGLLAIVGAEVVLLAISRVYTTRLQDRIIRLEMRVRAASVLTPEQQRLLHQQTVKQVVALRFASDAEMGALLERTARERLAPKDIKRAITSWTPDLDRT